MDGPRDSPQRRATRTHRRQFFLWMVYHREEPAHVYPLSRERLTVTIGRAMRAIPAARGKARRDPTPDPIVARSCSHGGGRRSPVDSSRGRRGYGRGHELMHPRAQRVLHPPDCLAPVGRPTEQSARGSRRSPSWLTRGVGR